MAMQNTFQFVMHTSIMKYSAKDPQICKPMKIKERSKELFCVCLFKTQNNVAVNNFYSGVTAGTAAIYLYEFANLWILGWNIS